MLDCLVIGGGPAGLTAGLYLARFNRSFIVLDAGAPRAAAIPMSHNIPLFPDGVSGLDLLSRQRAALRRQKTRCLVDGRVSGLVSTGKGFAARVTVSSQEGHSEIEACRVILATGAQDVELGLPNLKDAVQRGLIRYCPICDGYEARNGRLGVIGQGERGLAEAIFIARTYGSDVTFLTLGRDLNVSEEQLERARRFGVKILREPVLSVRVEGDRIGVISFEASGELEFDTLYSALGLEPRSQLGADAGAERNESGALRTDKHQQTSVPGLYAVGGVAEGLDQVVVAMGHAAVAATHVHNHCDRNFDEV